MSDDGLRKWLSLEGPSHLKWWGSKVLRCVDVSHNKLTDEGAEHLISFLLDRKQGTERLMLHHNRLQEPSAICRFLEDPVCGVGADDGLMELHLSHNLIRVSFLEQLLEALSRRVSGSGRRPRHPFWLRLEQNEDLASESAERVANSDFGGLKMCMACNKRDTGCTLRHCKYGADVHLVLKIKGKR